MKKGDIRLHNVIFPIWLVWLFPQLIWMVLPVNFLVDLLVLVIALAAMHINGVWKNALGVIWRVWVCGFLADIAGTAFLFLVLLLPGEGAAGQLLQSVAMNPFDNLLAFLWATLAIVLSGVLIYVFNKKFCLKNLNVSDLQKKRIALVLAIATAPYLFYLPTVWFI